MSTTHTYKPTILLVLLLITAWFYSSGKQPAGSKKKILTIITLHFKQKPVYDSLETHVLDGLNLTGDSRIFYGKIKNDTYVFKTYLDHPVQIAFVHNQFYVFADSAGHHQSAYAMFEPGDRLAVDVGSAYSKGILNVVFKGRGAAKFAMLQEHIIRVNSRPVVSPFKQTLKQQFLSADTNKKMGEEILLKYKKSVSREIRNYYSIAWLGDQYYYPLRKLGKVLTTSDFLSNRITAFKMAAAKKESLYDQEILTFLGLIADLEYGLQARQNIPPDYAATNKIQHYLNLKHSYTGMIAQSLCTYYLALSIKRKGIDSQIQKSFTDYKDTQWVDQSMKRSLDQFYTEYSRHTENATIMPFELEDTTGVKHTLAEFKNQVTVVDFYFYGCGGCLTTKPLVDSLEKIYAGKPVKFIGLSVDKQKDLWKKAIRICSTKSALQLYTNGLGARHPLIEYYKIFSYPTIMLIGKTGKLITARAPDPRSKQGWREFNDILKREIDR